MAELIVASVLLALLGAAVWGSHVFDGGFYWADDWYHSRLYLYPDFADGFFSNRNPKASDFRPVLVLLLAAPFRAFGLRTELHIALGIVLSIGASASFYWLLRTMGMERLHAWMIAGLALLFPWSDSTRLWVTASVLNVAMIFFFAGVVLALHSLRSRGLRAWLLGAGSLALYVLSMLTYEIAGGMALVSVLLYAWWAGWGRAVRRWVFDVAGVGVTLLYLWRHQPDYHTDKPTLAEQAEHVARIVTDAVQLLWLAVLPVSVPQVAVAAAVLAVVGVAGLGWRRLAADDPARGALRRWLLVGGGAAVAVGLSYTPFVPGLPKYVPLAPGVLNRVNLLAAFAYAVLVYALLMLAATLLARLSRRTLAAAAVAGALGGMAVGAGYIARDVHDKRLWARGWQLEQLTLETVADLVPKPRDRTVIYTFGVPNYVGPGVPVFTLAGDLRNALRVRFRNPRIAGYPMRPPTRWVCNRDRMYPRDYFFGRAQGAPYGRGVFVHVRRRQAVHVRTPAQCRRWSAAFGHPPVGRGRR